MTIGYYPGCSLDGTSKEYNESLQAVCKALNIELKEIQDWNCCGASAAHNLNHNLGVALPARTLALAEQQGIDEILIPCAACYSRLASALHEVKKNENVRNDISRIISMPLSGKVKTINVIDFLQEKVLPLLDGKTKKTFAAKMACYYGCLYTRPKEISTIERTEDPLLMESIIEKAGATAIDWSFKTECCGAGLSIPRTDIIAKLSGKIVADASERGAEAIVVACPMCHSNLDMRRKNINSQLKTNYQIPVLFITQVLGLSLGLTPRELGMHRHMVNGDGILKSLQQITTKEA